MSHELKDNKDRRDRFEEIHRNLRLRVLEEMVLAFRKAGPLQPQQALILVMGGWGYNKRGAREKIDELLFLGMLERKKGEIVASTLK